MKLVDERYIESPMEYTGDSTSIFLAGGITGCPPDWQQEIAAWLIKHTSLVILTPRRANFPIGDPEAAPKQIGWEHDHLRKADMILFWFPREALCPIVLYELGAWSMTDKPIFVGVDPEYKRRQDVEIQTGLARPDVKIVYSLFALAGQIEAYVNDSRDDQA